VSGRKCLKVFYVVDLL